MNKLVSVCINAYNSEKYIGETLKSVCSQTYRNLQIIVVDDASTDATAEITQNFGDDRIELYRLEKNGHISNANNVSYSKIRGEYMVHIDSDDIMDEHLIEKSVTFLEEHPEIGACFCRPSIIDENGNSADEQHEFLNNIFKITAKSQADFVRLFFDSSNHLLHPGVTLRKSVIDEIGLHDLSMCYLHDFDYWARLILKYPIHVFDEQLIKYRMDTENNHNSRLNDKKDIAHNTEFARVIYKMINDCPDELFLEAFGDRLHFEGPHTHMEVELEKAFLLQKGLVMLPQNKILGITKISSLLQNPEYAKLAEEKFGFSVHDLYNIQSEEILHNHAKWEGQKIEARLLSERCAILQSELNIARTELSQCQAFLEQNQRMLNKTVEYRVGQLFNKFINTLKHIKHLICMRSKNGKKYKKCVMLYGFYGMNLGDDLFFDKLLTRYPNTLFLIYCTNNYRSFFEKYSNTKFYAVEDRLVQKINSIGNKLHIRELFELLLLKRSNGTVHIGGSIYQQIGNFELDYKIRKRRNRPLKPFFSISSNFGAYETEDFKLKWRKQFKKFKDICFRDRYSYNLFSDVKSTRYAPDLLFSYKAPETNVIPGSVAISIVDLSLPIRKMPQEIYEAYLKTLVKTVCNLANEGHKVTLLGFCSFEGDAAFIETLLNHLPEDVRQHVAALNYSFDNTNEIICALASAEYIIGTRLHSVILGLTMRKKVLPIVYNSKMEHILSDIGFYGPTVTLNEIANYSQSGLTEFLKITDVFDVSEHINSDNLQFEKLDEFLR